MGLDFNMAVPQRQTGGVSTGTGFTARDIPTSVIRVVQELHVKAGGLLGPVTTLSALGGTHLGLHEEDGFPAGPRLVLPCGLLELSHMRFWGASGYFWQAQWARLLSTFEGKEWILYAIGEVPRPPALRKENPENGLDIDDDGFNGISSSRCKKQCKRMGDVVPSLLFWNFNGLLVMADTTGKPNCILQYRIHVDRSEPVFLPDYSVQSTVHTLSMINKAWTLLLSKSWPRREEKASTYTSDLHSSTK
ncbi:hypothetical protein MC885_020608 [Smutsia gigantea]|nr:hypothetical protein MC885_020608 [Smutsia gigantea]